MISGAAPALAAGQTCGQRFDRCTGTGETFGNDAQRHDNCSKPQMNMIFII